MSAPFVTSLRARSATIRLAPESSTAVWTVRVQVAEVWDAVRVEALPGTPVREVKQAAMVELTPDVDAIDSYVVKLGGFEIHDEGLSLQAAGAANGSTLLLMARRRRPVR